MAWGVQCDPDQPWRLGLCFVGAIIVFMIIPLLLFGYEVGNARVIQGGVARVKEGVSHDKAGALATKRNGVLPLDLLRLQCLFGPGFAFAG